MATYKTPGVYIEEIPKFPASVAGVATAVPAFIGYVERAENNGVGVPFNTPVRITSLLEYENIFGKAEGQAFTIEINDNTSVTPTQRAITVAKSAESLYKLYYNIQMYYSNGGGPCYIVPVGLYSGGTLAKSDILAGLAAIAKVDEPTLLLFPDAVSLTVSADRKDIYDAALAQCQKLKDRFTIMDVIHTANKTVFQDATAFRNAGIGADNLKYGASYYPFINTTLGFGLNENTLHVTSQKENGVAFSASIGTINLLDKLELVLAKAQQGLINAKVQVANLSVASITGFVGDIDLALTNLKLTYLPVPANPAATSVINSITILAVSPPVTVTVALLQASVQTPGAFFSANSSYVSTPTKILADALITAYNTLITDLLILRNQAYAALNLLSGYVIGSVAHIRDTNPSLYNSISAQLAAYTVQLNPSGAMAGIYARVDNERGVWKAPANVGVRNITGPSINVTNSEQDDLNIDATSGKSINVIRSFTGRGTLVWGARTLAGNDNEWRYINVRRLFNYVEESVQEATMFVVFEPNTANTWQRVKGMVESFLTGLWREGALAGATTKDAFFVNVGLGLTMTAQDILEGRLIVEVGMAAVRPAEFIILQFEHKLQES